MKSSALNNRGPQPAVRHADMASGPDTPGGKDTIAYGGKTRYREAFATIERQSAVDPQASWSFEGHQQLQRQFNTQDGNRNAERAAHQ